MMPGLEAALGKWQSQPCSILSDKAFEKSLQQYLLQPARVEIYKKVIPTWVKLMAGIKAKLTRKKL